MSAVSGVSGGGLATEEDEDIDDADSSGESVSSVHLGEPKGRAPISATTSAHSATWSKIGCRAEGTEGELV